MTNAQWNNKRLSDQTEDLEPVNVNSRDRSTSSDKSSIHIKWKSPAGVGLLAAVLGLFGHLFVAWYNDRSTRELNAAKMQSDLIEHAVSTHSLQQSCRNLLFFIDTGLLSDPKNKIGQECQYPLQQTNIPFSAASTSSTPAVNEMGISVSKVDQGDTVVFHVAFTVPDEPDAVFNTVKIYCTQLSERERVKEKIYPAQQGNWKPGDRVTFSVDVPKALANAQTGWNLTFCVGTNSACFPSPNLLNMTS